MKYKYAVLEGDPVLLGEYEAWTFINSQWQAMSNADAFTKAMLLSHSTFLNMFGGIEHQLPPEAFTATEG